MKKRFFFATLASVALASCTSDEFLGNTSEPEKALTEAISFTSGTANVTRATKTGAEAAALLGNKFTVLGVQYDYSDNEGMVFPNYEVTYDGNVGGDDTNEYGWTYLTGSQNIKYWNLGANRYEFVAFSGLPTGKTISTTSTNTLEDMTATTVNKLYMSDRIVANYTGSTGVQYGQKVGFTFKRLAAKVRVGFYETVPGYAVTNIRFYYGDKALSPDNRDAVTTAGLRGDFPEKANYIVTYDAQNSPVANVDPDNFTRTPQLIAGNVAYQTATASDGKKLKLNGTSDATGDQAFLGTSSTEVSWAEISSEAWQDIMPYADNKTNLVLRVDYDLVPLDGGDTPMATIHVYNASAVVPYTWAQWKPNYAYTYVFKISDQTSGQTTPIIDTEKDTDGDGIPDVDDPDDDGDGIPDVDDPDDDGDGIPDEQDPDHIPDNPVVPDPDTENPNPNKPALTPIVFDAAVSAIEDFNQETITGVTALGGNAITTYSETSHYTDASEYGKEETIILTSPSHGQWKVGYYSGDITEKDIAANPGLTTYEIIAGATEDGQTIDQASVYEAKFTPAQTGNAIIWLRYLPTGLPDIEANYVDVFKVVKIHG